LLSGDALHEPDMGAGLGDGEVVPLDTTFPQYLHTESYLIFFSAIIILRSFDPRKI